MRALNYFQRNAGLFIAVTALMMAAACSKDKAVRVSESHPLEWSDTANTDFHGKKVLALRSSDYCAGCHGADFTGGKSGSSCRACHSPYPHPAGWVDMNSPLDHGKRFRSGSLDSNHFSPCMACHGPALAGGRAPKKCGDCHAAATVAVWASKP